MEENVFSSFKIEEGKIVPTSWVEWIHWGVPDEDGIQRSLVREFLAFFGHCKVCTSMDGCFYAKKEMPDYPDHKNCDCLIYEVPFSAVKGAFKAEFSTSKFTKYIFDKNNKQNKGKYELFTSWGYDASDTNMLISEMTQQAKKNFLSGNYEIRGNVGYGTIIRIPMALNGRKFWSGWLILPQGKIKCTTPYSAS